MARQTRTCPVCGAANDDLVIVCTSCKSFIQGKVDTIDLFHTIWGLVESPSATFRRIGLSGTKNYVLLLSALFGVACAYAYLWKTGAGAVFPGLATILGIGLAAGLVIGLLLGVGFALLYRLILPLAGGGVTFRNAFAVVAYAQVPVVISLILVFPLEIAVFGGYLFDYNPSPLVLNPAAFLILAGLDCVAVIWSYVLLGIGLQIVGSVQGIRGFLLAGLWPVTLGLLSLIRIW